MTDENVDLDAANASGECLHESEPYREESYEFTGKADYVDADKHALHYTYHWTLTCLDCGEVIDDGEEDITELADHNFTTDSTAGKFTCEVCGYSFDCGHVGYLTTETITEPVGDPGDSVVAKDEKYHTIKVHKWEQSHCERCDWRGEKQPVEDAEVTEPHEWDEDNGGKVCRKCGYENKCTHKNTEYVDEMDDVVKATKLNGDEHTAQCVLYANERCKDCGLIVNRSVVIESWTATQDHSFIELSDGTIGCSVCGYVIPCEHPYQYIEELSREDVGWKEPEQVNAQQHRVRRYAETYYRCKVCGREWGLDYPEDTAKVKLENHQWNDEGVCKICGYKNECTVHDFKPVVTGQKWDGTVDYKKLDARTHQVTIGVFQELACTKCGFTIVDHVDKSTEQTFVEEHYWSPEGKCVVCGCESTCKHPSAYVEKLTDTVSREDLGVIDSSDKTHTVYADRFVNYHCTRCDAWWGYEVTEYYIKQEKSHEWDSNEGSVCVICGHENKCTHVGTTEEYEDEDFRLIPSMTTATTHSKNPFGVKGKRCSKCGADFERVATGGTDKIVTEPHKFVNRGGKTVCEVCGYIKPAKKTESSKKTTESTKEEKTEGSTLERVADGTVVHGVTVGQPTRMGVTLARAMAGIAAEYGSDVRIEIENIEKVLTADEYASLNGLQPSERVLVALDAIGYDDEVNNAIAELQLTLSEKAQELSLEVNARVEQMDDEAKAAHQKAIEKYFPNANGVTITLVIRKTGGAGVRRERYSFVQANGVWQFAKLEVTKA